MKKILFYLALFITTFSYSQTALTLGRIDTIWSTGQVPKGANLTNTFYTLYNRSTDTTSLSNRINQKLNKTDTSYLHNEIVKKLNYADTSYLHNEIAKRLNYADTSYLHNEIIKKLNYSDTSLLHTQIVDRLKYTDTTLLHNQIATKLAKTDTSYFGHIKTIANGYGILGGASTATVTPRVDTASGKVATQYYVNNHIVPLTTNVSGILPIANGGSNASTIELARVNFGIDKITNGGNTAYNILATDKVVYTGTAFTSGRIWTLPDASTVNAGYEIIIADFLQTVTSTNTLTVAVQSGQKLNGTANGTELMQSSGGWRRLISDGVSNWTFDVGVVRLNATQTLTNKRITTRSGTTTSSATPTINTDNVNYYSITALSTAITSFTTNLSGTPNIGDKLWISITDNGVARTITWGASFEASGSLALPTTTVAGVRGDDGFIWDEATSKWRICAAQ